MKYNNQIKKGISDIKGIKMSSKEKEGIFNNLDTYMKENPVKEIPARKSMSYWLFTQTKVHRYAYYSIAFVLIFGIIGANVMYAAEKALPGDMLYTVKINLNEKVETAVAVTPKAKAKLEAKRVIRRLDEVEMLIQKGKFDDKKRELVERELERSAKFLKVDKLVENIDIEKEEFKNKLNDRLGHIKEIDIEKTENQKQREEFKKFEDKVKIHLSDFINEKKDEDDDKNGKKDQDRKDV